MPLKVDQVTLYRIAPASTTPVLVLEAASAGTVGWALVPDRPALREACLTLIRSALGTPLYDAGRRWQAQAAAHRWNDDALHWTVFGALEAALGDCAARHHGQPLWRWLGGSARDRVTLDGGASIGEMTVEITAWAEAEQVMMDGPTRAVRFEPLRWGGAAGVARLDAVARAFQVELALQPETPLLASVAYAVHLAATTPMVTLPLSLPGSPVEVPWCRAAADFIVREGAIALPNAPGLGVDFDRAALAAHASDRVTVSP
jgi:L-alanine-DL-glutamate epimerase-like enolase superfamily enzyme